MAALVLVGAGAAPAGVVRNATNSKTVSFDWVMFNGTGSELFIATSSDQFAPGSNPDHVFQIAVFDPATGAGTQLTSFAAPLTHVRHNLAVSEDGQWLTFISHGDLVPGQNGNRNSEVFVLNRTTLLLTQITKDASTSPGQVSRIALAGDGDRITFASNSNLTGGNPQRAGQVYVVDRDGSNLAQLTNAPTGLVDHLWISDNGSRIAFSHNGNMTGGNADGNFEVYSMAVGDTLPRQITSSATGNSTGANISGDGNTLVWESTANPTGGNGDGLLEIFAADWTTPTIIQVTNSMGTGGGRQSRQPWPTDDGLLIFFASNQAPVTIQGIYEIFKINKNGTGLTRLTTIGQDAEHPVVSGGGERFGTWLEDGMYAATGTGTGLLKLIDRKTPDQGYPDLSTDGKKISLEGPANPTGNNADGSAEVFFINASGVISQLTQLGAASYAGRNQMDGAGTRVYYESNGNPLGTNNDLSGEIFGINTDGTGVRQYTFCTSAIGAFSGYPDVSDDGTKIAFASVCNLTGGNADFGAEIFLVNPNGTGLVQLTTAPSPSPFERYVYWPRLDSTGTWVAFSGNANIAGGNTEGNFEVWRMKTDGTNRTQITSQALYDSFYPDISGDGSRVVFLSRADLIAGQNTEHNGEVFLWEPAAVPALRQLTQTTSDENSAVRISRDGEYAFFISTHRFGETPSSGANYWLYRVTLDTGAIERAGGFASEASTFIWWPAVSGDGSKVAYATETGDPSGRNPDDYWEINLVDHSIPNAPVPSPGPTSTTTTFEAEPGALRFDVVRGQVASLSADATNVFLGPVVCLENDSGDANTVGFPDPDTPGPGDVYFYLFRGSKGIAAGPGSFGMGSLNKTRLAGAGDCATAPVGFTANPEDDEVPVLDPVVPKPSPDPFTPARTLSRRE
jgi:hypothetical protein